jgi:DNA-binding transcriptional ArsR family regulator
VTRLARGESTVGELARPYPRSPAAISRHLGVLQAASLIVCERRGQHRVCGLDARTLSTNRWVYHLISPQQYLQSGHGASHPDSEFARVIG